MADTQQGRIEALVAAGIDVDWAVGYIEANARRANAGIPALIANLECQAEAHLERIQVEAERRAAEEDAATAWRENLERPRFRPAGGFTAPLRPVSDHNGEQAEEEDLNGPPADA